MRVFLFCAVLLFLNSNAVYAEAVDSPREIGIRDSIGNQLPATLPLSNENGEAVSLASYFKEGRPLVLTFVYFECPSICTVVLNELVEAMNGLSWKTGQDFDFVAISIHPKEGPDLAKEKKAAYLREYKDPQAGGWHFLTGSEASIREITTQAGFKYWWDGKSGQYVHVGAAYFLSPDGKIARVLQGTSFKAPQMKAALYEAANKKIGGPLDRLLMRLNFFGF